MVVFSILSYRFNSYPEETIAVGLIFIDPKTDNFKFKVSDLKMKIASKVLPTKKHVFKFFKNTVDQMLKSDGWNYQTLDRSHRYQNGLIKWSKPSEISTTLDDFDQVFKKWIEKQFNTD